MLCYSLSITVHTQICLHSSIVVIPVNKYLVCFTIIFRNNSPYVFFRFFKITLIRILKCFNPHPKPLSKAKGERMINRTRGGMMTSLEVVLLGDSNLLVKIPEVQFSSVSITRVHFQSVTKHKSAMPTRSSTTRQSSTNSAAISRSV